MLGKVVRMLLGRSMAKKRGFSGAAGAAAGLIAPYVLRRAGSFAARSGSAAIEARRRRRATKYLGPLT